MFGIMGTSWAKLLLLACIIALSTGQSCDDVTCCSGKVCVSESTGRSGRNRTRCVTPTSCDELVCPDGLVCVVETRGTRTTRTRAICQASCDSVDCPDFLQCEVSRSRAECVAPSNCSLVECPSGTSCQILYQGTRQRAVCLGNSSCDSVTCFAGSECFNATTSSNRRGTRVQILVEVDSDTTPIPLKSLVRSNGRTKRRSSKNTKTKKTGTSSGAVGQQDQDTAVCLPMCQGANVCPQGLVCEEQGYGLICREPRSCDELVCPNGQVCEQVTCGIARTRPNTRTGTMTNTGTRTRSNMLVRCVDVDSASGSGFMVLTEDADDTPAK